MVRLIICLFTLISLFSSLSSYAFISVTATIDKNPVMVNESFVLTITVDDDINTNALDTSPLMQDFIVGRTSVSSQTSMVNFNTTRTTTFQTVLIARKAGKLIIPSLPILTEKTQPITVSVLDSTDPNANKQQDLFITTEISAKKVYVQQQLTLTVKLHFSAELKRGSLTEPSLEQANITQIGKDKESDTIINGKRYRVIERTYAISPQQSGHFTLKSPLFSGSVMIPSTRRNSFLSFGESKPVSVIGEDIELDILPIPNNYQGVWLPSELLTIHQEWQPEKSEFKVGEPITRIITLTAAGLSEEQLPEINMEVPNGLKVYPDQAELHTGMNNSRLVSQKVRNFAVVANKAGTYNLPEITIPWWNTVTNSVEQATIAAQTIRVLPNADFTEEPSVTPQTGNTELKSVQPTTVYVEKSSTLQWIFLALWILTSLLWLLTCLKSKPNNKSRSKTAKANNSYLELMAACKQNNSEQVFTLLVPWFNSVSSSKVSTISDVIKNCQSPQLTNAIHDLQQKVYSKEQQDWQGQVLLEAITTLNKLGVDKQKTNEFMLNP